MNYKRDTLFIENGYGLFNPVDIVMCIRDYPDLHITPGQV